MPWLPVLHTPEEVCAFSGDVVVVRQRVWVAERSSVAIGFAAVEGEWLEHLYVDPGAQGAGVGRVLLDAAHERGWTVLEFDDEGVVANAGVMLAGLLAQRLSIEQLVDQTVRLDDRGGGANAGRKVMTMVSAMGLRADCIEDCDILRSGQSAAVLGHRVAAPSTLGTFLRAFTFGYVGQLELAIVEWVAWFNSDRLHSALGDIPPAEFETEHAARYLPSLHL